MDDHTDEPQDLQMLEPFKNAILFLADKVEAQQAQIDNLTDLLQNQIIGGIKDLYTSSVRDSGISALKQKYGEKVSPFESALPELGVKDWGSELYDHINDQKANTPDWGEEHESGTVDNLLKAVQDKIAKISSVTGAKPVAASVTLTKPEVEPVEDGDSQAMVDAINKMKNSKSPKIRDR
jgi:hypothetical protein